MKERDHKKLKISKMTVDELKREYVDINKKSISDTATDRGYSNGRKGTNAILNRARELDKQLETSISRREYEELVTKGLKKPKSRIGGGGFGGGSGGMNPKSTDKNE